MRYSTQVKPISHLKANAAQALALLKILALGNAEIEADKVKPVGEVVARLRAKQAAK